MERAKVLSRGRGGRCRRHLSAEVVPRTLSTTWRRRPQNGAPTKHIGLVTTTGAHGEVRDVAAAPSHRGRVATRLPLTHLLAQLEPAARCHEHNVGCAHRIAWWEDDTEVVQTWDNNQLRTYEVQVKESAAQLRSSSDDRAAHLLVLGSRWTLTAFIVGAGNTAERAVPFKDIRLASQLCPCISRCCQLDEQGQTHRAAASVTDTVAAVPHTTRPETTHLQRGSNKVVRVRISELGSLLHDTLDGRGTEVDTGCHRGSGRLDQEKGVGLQRGAGCPRARGR